MSKRSTRTVEEKLEIVQECLSHKQSIGQLSKKYQIAKSTIKDWIRKYESQGIEGLQESRTWKRYSQELKEEAVQDYLAGGSSLQDICRKYNISDTHVLRDWIKRYTSGKELQATSKGLSRMKQGRKTSFEERVEIVNFTIAHEKDYQSAVEKFSVSYQQVYSWVKKFEKEGAQGLVDRRGKGLESKENLTAEEELQLKIKQLEERNRYLEMEVGLLKKLEVIGRRNRR